MYVLKGTNSTFVLIKDKSTMSYLYHLFSLIIWIISNFPETTIAKAGYKINININIGSNQTKGETQPESVDPRSRGLVDSLDNHRNRHLINSRKRGLTRVISDYVFKYYPNCNDNII